MFKSLVFSSIAVTFFTFLSPFSEPSVATTIDCGSTPSEIKTQLSFACFGTIEQDGSIPADYNSDIGYDISRQWQAGYHITQVLKLGDLAESFSPHTFTISNMISSGGGDINSVLIKDFPLIQQQSLSSLISAVPSLKQVSVANFPGLDSYEQTQTLSQLLQQSPSLNNLTLEDLGLGEISLTSIPGLAQAQLNQFSGWAEQFLADLPYFSTIPLSQMPTAWLPDLPVIARIDALRSQEGPQQRTLSGSYQDGFSVRCSHDCDYIELDDLENAGTAVSLPLEGIRWISGKNQKVTGGEGCLAWVNDGIEPTGIHPFGPAFKVVLWDVNPQTEKVTTKLFFRLRANCLLFGSGSTPYFIGPVSWMTHNINDFVVAGVEGQTFHSSSTSSPNTTTNNGDIYSGTNQPITAGSNHDNSHDNDNVTATNSHPPSTNSTQIPPTLQTPIDTDINPNPIDTDINPNPIDLDITWSSWQFSQVLPANSYTATSNYLCHHQKCGYSMGVFHLSSTDPFVMAAVGQTNAGSAWLNQVNDGATPTWTQINQFFPKTLQQEVFEAKLNQIASSVQQQIDPLTQKTFTGERKVQRIAQVYYGGEGAKIDADIPVGLQSESLLQASRNLVNLYLSRNQSS